MGKGRALLLAAVAATAAVVEASPSAAQSSVSAAAKAFSLGQQAELAGDHRAASEHYELADRMVPSPEALRSAVKTRLKAGDEAIAATHAETLARRYRDERSQEIAADLLKRLRPRLARVSLSCTPACGALADGGAIGVEEASEHVFYLEPGQHTVAADFGAAGSLRQVVDARAGKTVAVDLAAPQAPAAAAMTSDPTADAQVAATSSRRSGLSRGWFVASAAVTVGLAGVTIWSGLDVLDRNDAYERDPTRARLEDGQSAELRTNILLGATAAAAVGTGVIAFFTSWSPSGEAETAPPVSVAPIGGGAMVVFEGGFR